MNKKKLYKNKNLVELDLIEKDETIRNAINILLTQYLYRYQVTIYEPKNMTKI